MAPYTPKTGPKRLPTRFEPVTRSDVRPLAAPLSRAIQEAELERLERRLLTERLGELRVELGSKLELETAGVTMDG